MTPLPSPVPHGFTFTPVAGADELPYRLAFQAYKRIHTSRPSPLSSLVWNRFGGMSLL